MIVQKCNSDKKRVGYTFTREPIIIKSNNIKCVNQHYLAYSPNINATTFIRAQTATEAKRNGNKKLGKRNV